MKKNLKTLAIKKGEKCDFSENVVTIMSVYTVQVNHYTTTP